MLPKRSLRWEQTEMKARWQKRRYEQRVTAMAHCRRACGHVPVEDVLRSLKRVRNPRLPSGVTENDLSRGRANC